MEPSTKNYLQLAAKGAIDDDSKSMLVAIQPYCGLHNIDSDLEMIILENDSMLCRYAYRKHLIGKYGDLQTFYCIHETMFFGWLYHLRTDSILHKLYQRECNKVLYEFWKKNEKYAFNSAPDVHQHTSYTALWMAFGMELRPEKPVTSSLKKLYPPKKN